MEYTRRIVDDVRFLSENVFDVVAQSYQKCIGEYKEQEPELNLRLLELTHIFKMYTLKSDELINTATVYYDLRDRFIHNRISGPEVMDSLARIYGHILEMKKSLHKSYTKICCCLSEMASIAKKRAKDNAVLTPRRSYRAKVKRFARDTNSSIKKFTQRRKASLSITMNLCIQQLHKLYRDFLCKLPGVPALHHIVRFANGILTDTFSQFMTASAIVLNSETTTLTEADNPIGSSELLSEFDPRSVSRKLALSRKRRIAVKVFYLSILWKFIADINASDTLHNKHQVIEDVVQMLHHSIIPQMRNLLFIRGSKVFRLAKLILRALVNEMQDYGSSLATPVTDVRHRTPSIFLTQRAPIRVNCSCLRMGGARYIN